MDPPFPMILPKGIVVNAKDVYKEVAAYPSLPMDKIWEYWHVYTVTNKKLEDPTARRLENFWWHVWGSDRRHLSGRALARIYEDISVGPTFAPLRGPPNRWEGPDPSPLEKPPTPHPPHSTEPSEQRESPSANRVNGGAAKNILASAQKPQPSHPILKKARGPSTSGPRPTARFVSPHESAEEDAHEDEEPSSVSTSSTAMEARNTVVSPAKKKSTSSRKFVATSSAAKRRPLLPRRPSSQTSTTTRDTENGTSAREAASSAGSRGSLSQRTVAQFPEQTSRPTKGSQRSHSATSLQKIGLSAKSAGKRPAVQRRTTVETIAPEPKRSTEYIDDEMQESESEVSPIRQAQSLVNLPDHSNFFAAPKLMTNIARPSMGAEDMVSPKAMSRSQSHQGYERSKDDGQTRALNHGLFTGATASTTHVAAQGTIIDQSGLGSMPLPTMLGRLDDDDLSPRRPSAPSILSSRLTPTQPSPLASVPLARTKSQLTLLLEREKARVADKSRSKNW